MAASDEWRVTSKKNPYALRVFSVAFVGLRELCVEDSKAGGAR